MKYPPFNCTRILVFENWTAPLLHRFLLRRVLNGLEGFCVADVQDSGAKSWENANTKPQDFNDVLISFNDTDFSVSFTKEAKEAKVSYALDAFVSCRTILEALFKFLSKKYPKERVEGILAIPGLKDSLGMFSQSLAKSFGMDADDPLVLEKALLLDPQNPEILWRLAVVEHMEQKNAKKAAAHLEVANASSPFYVRTYLSAALVYRDLKNSTEAKQSHEYACKHMAYNPWPFHNYGIHLFNDLKKPKDAIEQFKKAASFSNPIPETYYNMGICYRSLKEHLLAASAFEKHVSLRASDVLALLDTNRFDEFTEDGPHEGVIAESILKAAEEYRDGNVFSLAALFFERYLKATWSEFFMYALAGQFDRFESANQDEVVDFGSQLTRLLELFRNAMNSSAEISDEGLNVGNKAIIYFGWVAQIFPGDPSVVEEQGLLADAFLAHFKKRWRAAEVMMQRTSIPSSKHLLNALEGNMAYLEAFKKDVGLGSAFLMSAGRAVESNHIRSYLSLMP